MFGCVGVFGLFQWWLQEWIYDEYVESFGLMIDVWDLEYGEMIQFGFVVWMEESGEEVLKFEFCCKVIMFEVLVVFVWYCIEIFQL